VSAFIDEKRERFGVQPICATLGVSASAFYHRASGPRSARDVEDERLLALIREIHLENYEAYGYRRCWKALLRAGHTPPRCRVQRLMRENGIQGAKRRGKPWRTTISDPAAAERPDLVNRDFTASRPGELLVADFTYLRCWQGVVYFAFVLDVYSRRIVGWQFASNMRAQLVVDALQMAIGTRERVAHVELVHHSDRGSQYTSDDLAAVLAEHDGRGHDTEKQAKHSMPHQPTHRRLTRVSPTHAHPHALGYLVRPDARLAGLRRAVAHSDIATTAKYLVADQDALGVEAVDSWARS